MNQLWKSVIGVSAVVVLVWAGVRTWGQATGPAAGPTSAPPATSAPAATSGPAVKTPPAVGKTGSGGGLMGSADYKPTADRPVGWRGDGTGRYPGANPPATWSRRVKGITSELKCQAAKPSGEPTADAKVVEYFCLKDWLVVGPFDAADPAKDIDKDFLNGEAAASPNAADKVGTLAWKPLHVCMETQSGHAHNEGTCRNLCVDFVYAFGTFTEDRAQPTGWADLQTKISGDIDNKIAYAHTYVYSTSGGAAGLRVFFAGSACKAWLNGKPVTVNKDADVKVDLIKGWNRILAKVATAKAITPVGGNPLNNNWRIAAYITPIAPISYETKNIAWMTRVTGRSASNPIVVGEKIFVGSGISDVMCFNKSDGKVEWIHSSTPWDALTAEEKAKYKDQIEPQVTQLERLNDEAVKAINAMISPQGMTSTQQSQLDGKLREKADVETRIHSAFAALDRKRFVPMNSNEVSASNATPCSDGQRVYWAAGGGGRGGGANMVVCFDLAGKRLWSYHESFGAAEHGLHTSPMVVDGKVVYGAYRDLIAFDAVTGKVAWKQRLPNGLEFCGNSPQAVRIGSGNAILTHHPALFRTSDGGLLAASPFQSFGDLTPIVEKGVIYNPDKSKGWGNRNVSFVALGVPAGAGQFSLLWELQHTDAFLPLRGNTYFVSSPLYVDGIVYALDMSGELIAVDASAHKSAYRQWLDWYNRYDRMLYGAVASPTLGGKNIYLVDDAGSTIVLQPGAKYKEVGRNVLENVHLSGLGGNPCKQETFYSSPVFDADSIYLKGEEYMYCIRAKTP